MSAPKMYGFKSSLLLLNTSDLLDDMFMAIPKDTDVGAMNYMLKLAICYYRF